MQKTRIEWVKNPDGTQGFSANPIKGQCPVGCKWCYAWGEDNPQALCKRFKWDTKLRFDPKVLERIKRRKKPAGIFMCSTMELFHHTIPEEWKREIFTTIEQCRQHRFYILTKNSIAASIYTKLLPANIWMGMTVTGQEEHCITGTACLLHTPTFISFEPLLNSVYPLKLRCVNWLILGAQTGGKKADRVIPKKEWVEPILEQADKHNIPVFIKNNMKELVNQWGIPFRQEMPK